LLSTQTREIHTRGRVRIDQSDVYTCWVHLFTCLRRLEVPFIGPRGLGAVGSNPGRRILPSVGWHTGQSGAPPDTVRCPISFQNWRSRPLQSWSRWRTGHCPVHTGQSGAHRTVRCTHLTVGSATRHTRIARPTVGPADRWLTGQSGEL
jgi:hypothetical protein